MRRPSAADWLEWVGLAAGLFTASAAAAPFSLVAVAADSSPQGAHSIGADVANIPQPPRMSRATEVSFVNSLEEGITPRANSFLRPVRLYLYPDGTSRWIIGVFVRFKITLTLEEFRPLKLENQKPANANSPAIKRGAGSADQLGESDFLGAQL